MKKSIMIAGATFFVSGTLLLGMVYSALANYIPQMSGWSEPPGKFSMALEATMLNVPLFLSILLMLLGFGLLVLGIYFEVMNIKVDTYFKGTKKMNGLPQEEI